MNFLKKTLAVLCASMALAVASQLDATLTMYIAIAIGLACVVSFFRNVPHLSDSKGFTIAILSFCVLMPLIGGAADRAKQGAVYLAELRQKSPEAYLNAIQGGDQAFWLRELKELDPKRHEQEVARVRAEQESLRLQQEAKQAAEQEERKTGFHCLSGWDGAHTAFKRAVNKAMRDPNSFEHIETRVTPMRDGWHNIFMTYRAANGFGGLNVAVASGRFSNSDCSYILESYQ